MPSIRYEEDSVISEHLVPSAAKAVNLWLHDPAFAEFRTDILALIALEDWETLNNNFYQHVEFGTAGIRGTTGVGPNRINTRTIGESAQGLVNYLRSLHPGKPLRIVVAYDTRLTSLMLAKHAARIFAANDVHTYFFDGFRSTPELSFAVRDLQADSGIVISASHNPPPDNGFKVYNESGGQIIPEQGDILIGLVKQVRDYQSMPYEEAVAAGKIETIGPDLDERYHQAVLGESVGDYRSATLVYSPIHGAGQTNVLPVLEKAGFDVVTVKEQMIPDGHFPNVANNIPNPELPEANDAAKKLLIETGRDLAITNDPDADRLAAYVKTDGEPVFLNGNQIASLATYYVFSTLEEQGRLPKNGFLARNIVTTPLIDRVGQKYGLKVYNDLLVGFKYIAELIRLKQDHGDEVFLLGGEESFGMLKGSYVRDKDGAVAALMLAELASKLKDQGRTLIDALEDAYRAYGYYAEHVSFIFFEGMAGAGKRDQLMASLRDTPPASLGDFPVVNVTHQIQDSSGMYIVKYELEGVEAEVFVRPSGTEPKVKFYVLLRDGRAEGMSGDIGEVKREADAVVAKIDAELMAVAHERSDSEPNDSDKMADTK